MKFRNGNMEAFYQSVSSFIPTERIFLDATRRLAWGTDAGFYRLIPEMVVFHKTRKRFRDCWPGRMKPEPR